MNKYYAAIHVVAGEMEDLAEKLDGPRITRTFTPREKQLMRVAENLQLEHDLQDSVGQDPL